MKSIDKDKARAIKKMNIEPFAEAMAKGMRRALKNSLDKTVKAIEKKVKKVKKAKKLKPISTKTPAKKVAKKSKKVALKKPAKKAKKKSVSISRGVRSGRTFFRANVDGERIVRADKSDLVVLLSGMNVKVNNA